MPANVTLKIRTPDGQRASFDRLANISLGGIFVEMPEPLSFGEDLVLHFALPKDPAGVTCGGFVVWSTKTSPDKARGKKGIAVRLTDIGVAEMRSLAKAIGTSLD